VNTLATQPRVKKLKTRYEEMARETWTELMTRDVHEKTQKQQDAMIPMKEVHERREELAKQVNGFGTELTPGEYDTLLMWTLVCLYTEIQPRRNQDYTHMVVVEELPEELDPEANYLVLSDHQFVFNKYKTKKHYGQQVVDIPETLMEHLTHYMKYHPCGKQDSFHFLVTQSGAELNRINGITRYLNRAFGKNIAATALRHIYLSDKYAENIVERERDAAVMAHSMSTQNSYVKF
jgi:hypothetical protein